MPVGVPLATVAAMVIVRIVRYRTRAAGNHVRQLVCACACMCASLSFLLHVYMLHAKTECVSERLRVCVCVCIYIYIYIYIWTDTYVSIHVFFRPIRTHEVVVLSRHITHMKCTMCDSNTHVVHGS
jgi:hypothetical protein